MDTVATEADKLADALRQLRTKKGQLDSALKEKVAPISEMIGKIEARLLQLAIEQTNVSALVGSYRQLRDSKGQMEAAVKAAVKPTNEMLERIEAALLQISIDQKVTSFKTEDGTAYKYKASSVRVKDWPSFLEYVQDKGEWELLTRGASKSEVEALQAQLAKAAEDAVKLGAPPPEILTVPGIEFFNESKMGFRAPAK